MHLDIPRVDPLRGSFYKGPPAEDALYAEAYKWREESSASSTIIITATSSKSEDIDVETLSTLSKVFSGQIRGFTGFLIAPKLLSPTQTFTQREVSISEQIAYVRAQLDIPFANKLADRLEYLVKTSEEEFPEQEPISSRSLKDFIGFISSVSNAAYPAVVLTYSGNIRAEWTKAHNKHFAVEFFGDKDLRFVIFAPDSKRPYKTNRVSGQTNIDSLMELVQPYGISGWFLRPAENAA